MVLAAALACSVGYYLCTIFVELVVAAARGVWDLLGPKNCIGILLAVVGYAVTVGGWFTPVPCGAGAEKVMAQMRA